MNMDTIPSEKFYNESGLFDEMRFNHYEEFVDFVLQMRDTRSYDEYDETFDDYKYAKENFYQKDGGKSSFDRRREWEEHQAKHRQILRDLKKSYARQRANYRKWIQTERALTLKRYPTIPRHFLELFPMLSRVASHFLQAFKADRTKLFPWRKARLPNSDIASDKNYDKFWIWCQTVDFEEPMPLSVWTPDQAVAIQNLFKESKKVKKSSNVRCHDVGPDSVQPVCVVVVNRDCPPGVVDAVCSNNHIVASSLNGSNGEVTMSDDHDVSRDNYKSGAARRVAMNKTLHAKLTPHKAKDGSLPQNAVLAKQCTSFVKTGVCAYEASGKGKCKFDHPVVEERDSLSDPSLVARINADPIRFVTDTEIAWDGVNVYVKGVALGGLLPGGVVPPGTEVVGIGTAWYVDVYDVHSTAKVKTYQLVDPVKTYLITAQKYLGNWVSGFQGPVFQPGLDFLYSKITCLGVLDEAKSKTALSLLSVNFKNLPEYLIVNTHKYWTLRNLLFKRQVLESTDNARALASAKTEFLRSDFTTDALCALYRGANINYTTVNPVAIDASPCCVRPSMVLKRNFSSVQTKGVVWDKTSDYPYPVFTTRPRAPRWYTTQMCRFEGSAGSFVVYDNTPDNMSLAMKRLFAQREGEVDLYYNQIWLALQLTMRRRHTVQILQDGYTTDFINPEILAWCKCELKFRSGCGGIGRQMPYKVIIGDGANNHEVVLRERHVNGDGFFPDYVLDALMKPSSRSNRAHLTKIFDSILNKTTKTYWRVYQAYTEFLDAQGARDLAGQIDHVKRRLRQRYVKGVLLHIDEDVMVKSLTACIKREYAKVGKVPRLFISYDKGCMYANELPEWVKECINGAYHFQFGDLEVRVYIFAKPSTEVLIDEFAHLIRKTAQNTPNYNVLLFSDDSVHAGCINGRSFAFNVDITSTDSSNATLTFAATAACLAQFNKARTKGLIEQCCKPILLINPCAGDEKLTIQFHGPFEGSGTVLTTILNHIASYNGAILSAYRISENLSKNLGLPVDSCIRQGYADIGHLVTCETCCVSGALVPEKMQFLKRSPIWDGRKWIPTLNLGCILRSFGTLDSDMSAEQLALSQHEFKTMPWEDRMDCFLGGVVRGLVHEPDSCIVNALRERFTAGATTIEHNNSLGVMLDGVGQASAVVDPEAFNASLALRYDLNVDDLYELATHIRNIKLGGVSVTKAATNIYAVDYGLVQGEQLPISGDENVYRPLGVTTNDVS